MGITLRGSNAGIAQLVEHDLAKVGVASSSLVSRSSHATRGARGSWVAEGVGRRCAHGFGRVKSIHGQTRSGTIRHANAGIAQLVEHDLAKVGVASSSLVSRSSSLSLGLPRFCFFQQAVILSIAVAASSGQVAEWSCSGLQSRVRRFDPDPGLHCYCGDWMSGLRQSGFPPVNSITALSISTVWFAPWWR